MARRTIKIIFCGFCGGDVAESENNLNYSEFQKDFVLLDVPPVDF
jgi:hypothetical protein